MYIKTVTFEVLAEAKRNIFRKDPQRYRLDENV